MRADRCATRILFRFTASVVLLVAVHPDALHAQSTETAARPARTLHVVVMDPMAAPLSCACVAGQGQRDYDAWSQDLSRKTGWEVMLTFDESLKLAQRRTGLAADLIIGKHSVVRFDADNMQQQIRLVSRLSDPNGATTLSGVVLVRENDPARSLADLKGRSLTLGPIEDADCHAAARQLLREHNLTNSVSISAAGSLDECAYRLLDGETDAAVLPEFMPRFLEACGKMEPNALRVIGRTKPVPFVSLFATDRVNEQTENRIVATLAHVAENPELLQALESQRGFVAPGDRTAQTDQSGGWADWRGPGRRGQSPHVPASLPERMDVAWSAEVTGPAMAGIAATDEFVVVADKDADLKRDIFRCYDARSGQPRWTLEYPSERFVDYTNAPRATPVIADHSVYLQGVWGELHCVDLRTGDVLWKRNLLTDFDGEELNWGYSVPPLIVDDRLIVAPGGPEASLIALHRETGETLWQTPGHAAAYSPFLVTSVRGSRQVIGYDVAGLAGWDPANGRRLWELIPPGQSDFHVGTPVEIDGRILLATENNATRLYEFGEDGKLDTDPIAWNDDLAPDTCTPVVINNRIYASAYGELYCLDLENQLRTVWSELNDLYYDHTNLIAGNDRVLIWNTTGDLVLIRADVDRYEVVAHTRVFDGDVESMSHPAVVGNRLYLRSQNELKCLLLSPKSR